jgi:hypothetical protein
MEVNGEQELKSMKSGPIMGGYEWVTFPQHL